MNHSSLIVKSGRPTKYNNRIYKRVTEYTNNCLKNHNFPTIEHLAAHLGIGTRTIYDWEKEYPEFSQTIEKLRDAQRHLLITNGLEDKYNARFATFLLKASHGYSDAKPIVQATQNNYMDISPEILAEALEIMRRGESSSASDVEQ